jgi:hypothetical protein
MKAALVIKAKKLREGDHLFTDAGWQIVTAVDTRPIDWGGLFVIDCGDEETAIEPHVRVLVIRR